MNTRTITAFLVLGMAAALFFTYAHPSHRLLAPVIGSPVAAQTPASSHIFVKYLPNPDTGNENPWHRYEITLPVTSPPLDMHTVFLVDGKGEETVSQSTTPWSQPLPFRYRLDSSDDSRVKDILEAQGFAVKKNLVTYAFAAGAYGTISYNTTLRFHTEPGGQQEGSVPSDAMPAAIGEKIVLENRILSDRGFKGDFDKVFSLSQQLDPKFAPKTPPGMVHHLVVYLMFQPHKGSLAKYSNSRTYVVR